MGIGLRHLKSKGSFAGSRGKPDGDCGAKRVSMRNHAAELEPKRRSRSYERDGLESDGESRRSERSSRPKSTYQRRTRDEDDDDGVRAMRNQHAAKLKPNRHIPKYERQGAESDGVSYQSERSRRPKLTYQRRARDEDDDDGVRAMRNHDAAKIKPNRRIPTYEREGVESDGVSYQSERSRRPKSSYQRRTRDEDDSDDVHAIRNDAANLKPRQRISKYERDGLESEGESCRSERSGRPKSSYQRRTRDEDDDDVGEDVRDVRGERRSRGVRASNTKASAVDGRRFRRDSVVSANKGRSFGIRLSQEKPMYARGRVLDRGRAGARAARGPRDGKRDGILSSKSSVNSERVVFEDPDDELISNRKGRKTDGSVASEKSENDAVEKLDEDVEKRSVRYQKRLLDRSGNRIRGHKNSSEDDSVVANTRPPKKRKRGIRLDPNDISKKRLDDTVPNPVQAEKDVEEEVQISKNAQFRAIQPSPSILSFVEDNLLGRRRLNELQNAGYNIKLLAPLDNLPFSTCTERERIEENVFRNKLEFFAAAKISSSFPPPMTPEIAFADQPEWEKEKTEEQRKKRIIYIEI